MCSIDWCYFQWPWVTLTTLNDPIFDILSVCFRSVSRSVFQSLAVSLVLSRLNHGNATLSGIRQYLPRRLQSVINSAARLVFYSSRYDHITPLLCELHWLKAVEWIDFKLAVLVYKCLHGAAPSYLADELCLSVISAHDVAFVQRHLHHWSSAVRVYQPSSSLI